MFGQKLRYYHVIGTLSIVLACVSIFFTGILNTEEVISVVIKEEAKVGKWLPVLLGVITPMFFCMEAMLTKHLTVKEGF